MDTLAERFISPGKALSQQSAAELRLERAMVREAKAMLLDIKTLALARSLQPPFATNRWKQAIVDGLIAVGIERGSDEWRFLSDGLGQLDLGNEAYVSAMAVIRKAQSTYPAPSKEEVDALLDVALDLETPSLTAAGGIADDGEPILYKQLKQVGTIWRSRVKRVVRTGFTGFSGFVAQQAFRVARRENKQWVAHHDEKTRHTHLEANGQIVPVEGYFRVGAELLQYPGDRRGSLAETANCRCTMVSPN